ncbi:16S rRNA (uracil(1498)-N(3))-methyltransferase [Sulfitobacter sp. TSTF-M16]|uniref:Ribosomal RNA small subunit methyltransferase E n=1 Tax=Sulfitobacter aestuariivivens TaxID=2766981 RepID=A0A927D600_9RHOB|nr:16S rRNA (uracil(1498)-N(3))-methyltransferase [Sulfitobacter aestuariivivens]MBD3664454.1 16S rRNA (uracil(1498)-N(3))-methyltransferase [Sulfitobacter aestuariivivens]
MDAKIRLYVDQPLGAGQSVPLDRGQAHYLFGVMRQQVGASVAVFNGRDGEWRAQIAEAGKRGGLLTCVQETRPLKEPPDLWLLFAPIKKARTDFIVEKAAEMGARRIVPVMTEFTNAGRVQRERLQAHAVEAAEQCGGTFVPEVAEAVKFSTLLDRWEAPRQIMFCDEALAGSGSGVPDVLSAPAAIMIGPEGGFSDAERARLARLDHAHAVSLGPRILRADTAAVAALTLWQQALGDWT